MKVLGIGESIIDNVHIVDDIESKNALATSGEKHVGGPVLAAMIVLARMGVDCTLVTSLGRDDEAKIIRKALKRENVQLLAKIQKHTKVNTILVDRIQGKRRKVRGTVVHAEIKNLSRQFLRQFDLIIMDRHEKTAFYEVVKKKKPSAKIIIDPSTEISSFTMDMIQQSDYPIIPIEAVVRHASHDIMENIQILQRKVKKPVIVTAGEMGSIISTGNMHELVPSYNVKAIDVTGAGDVYRGAFAYGLTQSWDMPKCAAFANYVAGLQCTKLGNMAAIPTKEEMSIFEIVYNKKRLTIEELEGYFSQFEI